MSLKNQFGACLALVGSNVSEKAKEWGVNESTVRRVVSGEAKSANIENKIKDYIGKFELSQVSE